MLTKRGIKTRTCSSTMKEIQWLGYDRMFTEAPISSSRLGGPQPPAAEATVSSGTKLTLGSTGGDLERRSSAADSSGERLKSRRSAGSPAASHTSRGEARAAGPTDGCLGPALLPLSPRFVQSFIREHEKHLHFPFTQERGKNIGQLHFLWASYEL